MRYRRLTIDRYWDGRPCHDPRLHGRVCLETTGEGLVVTASLPHQSPPNIPDAPLGSRVANLWEYDVVERFLAGESTYLEVELGAGGHFLALDFSAPRVRRREYPDFVPRLTFNASSARWTSRIVIPWDMVPPGLKALNAFVSVRDHLLAYHPTPGEAPDFHQPSTFPSLSP
jgi:hypothetical protein